MATVIPLGTNLLRTVLFFRAEIRSRLRTLALKTGDFSKKSVVLVNAKMDLLKPSPGQKTLEK